MAEPDAAKYDQKDATIYGSAPESQGSAIVSGKEVHGNTVIGTQINIEPSQQPKPPGTPHNLPRSGAQFVGREQEIETLHQQLQHSDRIAISAIAGMGGIGKTELALQYAMSHLQQGTYLGGLCWLQSRGSDVGSQVVSFAQIELGLKLPEGMELPDQLRFCWSRWRDGAVLLIFDDVTDYELVESFLPPSEPRFKVLFTTRLHLGSSVKELRLDVLSEAAALDLLGKLAGEERVQGQIEDAKALCSWLGYLPLGLELVGRYLEGKPDLTLAKMQQRLESKGLEAKALVQAKEGMTADWGVATAFELSWQELSETAKQLGCLLSLFALAPIPWLLVESVIGQFEDDAIVPSDSEELEDLRDETLLKLHLLQRTREGTYQLHQLIREFFNAKREQFEEIEALKQGYCRAMVVVAKTIPQTPTLNEIATVAPSISHIGEAAMGMQKWLSDEELIWPFTGIGLFYRGQGTYIEATDWFERYLTAVRGRLGTEHLSTTSGLNNLATLYASQGRHEEAETLYLQALKIRKQQLGVEHPDTASNLNNLALLYASQGRYEEAEHLYLQALDIFRKQLGVEHTDTASNLNNLALLYKSQERYEEAEHLYFQVLDIKIRILGEGHLHTATSLNNLAALYRSQGRHEEAEPLYLQALNIRKRLLGERHPNTALSLNNLARLYESQTRYPEAEPLYVQALQIAEQSLGPDHTNTVKTRNSLNRLRNKLLNSGK